MTRSSPLAIPCVLVAGFFLSTAARAHRPITTNITFNAEIAQIFQRKCLQCHSEQNLGIPLDSYSVARPWARAIREEVLARTMPPWQGVSGYAYYSNDISLNAREREIILSWADGGAPSGVPKEAEGRSPVFVPQSPFWARGEPQLTLALEPQRIKAGAGLQTRRLEIDPHLVATRRVKAIALKQGDRRVVRYAAFYEQSSGRWLGSWTPWQTAWEMPAGVAYPLASGAKIIVEVGYSSTTEDVTDQSVVGLYFESSVANAARSGTIRIDALRQASAGHIQTQTRVAKSASLIALWPHPAPGVRTLEIAVIDPEGTRRTLVWIPRYNAEWPTAYLMTDPIELQRGSRLVATYNLADPTPTASAASPEISYMTVAPRGVHSSSIAPAASSK